MKRLLGIILISMMLLGTALAAPVDVTANVGNGNPVVGEIKICDGSCAYTKSLDPATQFTVQATITDPNGQGDINLSTLSLELYASTDTNGQAASWDNVAITPVSHGTRDGCTESGSTYCLNVETSDWTTKFAAGSTTAYVTVKDESEASDSNSNAAITVNSSVGHTEDSVSGTYAGAPSSSDNPILTDQTNAYLKTTHNGNVDIDISITATALSDGVHTNIAVGQQKWYLTDVAGSATPFTGGADSVKTSWGRGTSPTSAIQNVYMWLDIPALQPSGAYTGTLTYNSSAS